MLTDQLLIKNIKARADFPTLTSTNRGKPLVFLDSGASTQKPQQVIDAITHFYTHDYANIHRGIYELSARATQMFEHARSVVRNFIHAALPEEIIFVRGATEAINLVAQSYGLSQLTAGDEILISEMEHHANIVPWYMLAQKIGIKLVVIPITEQGEIDLTVYKQLFTPRTRLVAVTHVSNVLGTINPINEMAAIAHQHGAKILIDGAQSTPHLPVDVQQLDCDFFTFSGHKTYGPTGIGILYARKTILDAMPPYQGGGSMIETVAFDNITYAPLPNKFEAGTPDIAAAIGLGVALNYLQAQGMPNLAAHDQRLNAYALDMLATFKDLRLIGTAPNKIGVISFVHKKIHPHDLGTVLDNEGIAVRAGHHCAMPLMKRFNIPATIRVSFGLYNTKADIDALIAGLHVAERLLT
jgi:cysteine desulfurase/selenocysteine lyase